MEYFIMEHLIEIICDCKMLLRSRNEIKPKTSLELLTFTVLYRDVFPILS